MNPRTNTTPPSDVNRTVNQATVCRSSQLSDDGWAATENVTAAQKIPTAYPSPMRTMSQPITLPGRRITSTAPTDANAMPSTAKLTSAESPNPNVLWSCGTGSTIRMVIAPNPPAMAAIQPMVA